MDNKKISKAHRISMADYVVKNFAVLKATVVEAIEKSVPKTTQENISDFVPNPYNRPLDREGVDACKAEIKTSGVVKPVIYIELDPHTLSGSFHDSKKPVKMLIDGHHRWEALKEMGYSKIPAIRATNGILTSDAIKEAEVEKAGSTIKPKVKIKDSEIKNSTINIVVPPPVEKTTFERKHVRVFTSEEIKEVANKLGVNWDKIGLDQLIRGTHVELEHADVTGGALEPSIKIALAHIEEVPDYYTRLEQMEEEGKTAMGKAELRQKAIDIAKRSKYGKVVKDAFDDALRVTSPAGQRTYEDQYGKPPTPSPTPIPSTRNVESGRIDSDPALSAKKGVGSTLVGAALGGMVGGVPGALTGAALGDVVGGLLKPKKPKWGKDAASSAVKPREKGKTLLNKDELRSATLKVIEEKFGDISKVVRREGSKYVLYSKDGNRKLGEASSKEGIMERERQVQYFKHKKSDNPTDVTKAVFGGGGGGDRGFHGDPERHAEAARARWAAEGVSPGGNHDKIKSALKAAIVPAILAAGGLLAFKTPIGRKLVREGVGRVAASFGAKRIGQSALASTVREGGSTINVLGKVPKQGFAVSIHPERELKVPAASATAQHYKDYIKSNKDLLSKPDKFFGAWHNSEDNQHYLDVIHVHPDEAGAMALGRKYGQKAIYDLANKKEIRIDYPTEGKI